jgi:hypothetical protein
VLPREEWIRRCPACHGLIHEGKLFETRRVADGIEFRNRCGEPLVTGGDFSISLPRSVLRLLHQEREDGGGQPPRRPKPAESKIPEEIPKEITGEWFKAHMDRFEPGRDGTWRPIKSARR